MYLTKENYRDIERWLKLRGIKDIKFPRTDRVRNKDLVPIIQDGMNKIISAREFALQLGCIYVPDEEDITSIDSFEGLALKFNDKKVEPTLYSGMGRKFIRLKKDILPDLPIEEGKTGLKLKPLSIRKRKPLVNYLLQEDFPDADTAYIVQYDHDLKGETIVIPENCALIFNGGTLNNGTITVNETQIYGVIQLSDTGDVTYNGTFYDGQVMSFSNKSYVLTDDLYNNDESTLEKPEVRYWNGTEWEKLSLYDEVTELQEEMDQAQADIDALEERCDSLEERMDTAEADIDALEGRMDTAESTLADHESRLSTAEGTILKLDEWVAALDASVTSLNSSVEALSNSFNSLYSDWLEILQKWEEFEETINNYISEFNETISNTTAALDNYYTKTEVDNLLANLDLGTSGSTISYAATTTSSSDGAYVIGTLTIDGTEYTLYGKDTQGDDVDLSDYYTKTEIDALLAALDTGGEGSTVTYVKSYTGTSGIQLGTLTINGTAYEIYSPSLADIIEQEYDVFKKYVTQVINEGDIEIGSTVSVEQIITSGTAIATVTIGDDDPITLYAPSDTTSDDGSTVSWAGSLTSGTVIGTLTIDGAGYTLYAPKQGFLIFEDDNENQIQSSSDDRVYFHSGDGIDVSIVDGDDDINFSVNTTWLQQYITNNINNWDIDLDATVNYTSTTNATFYLLGYTTVNGDTIDTVYRSTVGWGSASVPIYITNTGAVAVCTSIDESLLPDSVLTKDNVGDYVSFTQTLTSGTEIGRITINGEETVLYAPTSSDSDDSSSSSSDSYWYLSGSSLYAGTSTTPSYAAYATAFYETSDKNLKENIGDVTSDDLRKAAAVNILRFNFKTGIKETKYGVIAQEVEAAGLENLVSTNKEGLKAVDYISLLSLKVANLEKENRTLKAENEDLKARLEKIESLLNINSIE